MLNFLSLINTHNVAPGGANIAAMLVLHGIIHQVEVDIIKNYNILILKSFCAKANTWNGIETSQSMI